LKQNLDVAKHTQHCMVKKTTLAAPDKMSNSADGLWPVGTLTNLEAVQAGGGILPCFGCMSRESSGKKRRTELLRPT
jgi:hypothetical protein